ncbi:MAG: hypothetical protein P4L53_11930 [Candidatus Obscuribacterales bacterium]|nr:hypothetical protein [Candidatus Obscuribacterales bacterium]
MSIAIALDFGLQAAGILMIGLAISHVYISKLLNWQEDVKKLTPINAQVFWAHTLFLAWGLMLLGFCCLFFPSALTNRSTLGALASVCFAMCWLVRLVFQFTFFVAKFHENEVLHTALRVLSTCLWIYFTALFSILFAYQCGVIKEL